DDSRAHAFARPLHVIRCAPGKGIESRIAIGTAHVTAGAQAALEHPRFDIEPVRIDRAVRPFEANDKTPALTGGDRRNVIGRAILAQLRIPRERHPRGNNGAARFATLYVECESRTTRRGL